MTKFDGPSSVKRRRMNVGPSFDIRQKWGADWICGYCRVDIFPTRMDCFKCGRHRDICELRDAGPRDMCLRGMGPRDMGPRFDPRDRFGPDPRDRFGPDPRDRFGPDPRNRFGPDPRDRNSGPPDGFTCRCGNFNRLSEATCVKCGRPNDEMWHGAQLPIRRFSPGIGGRRSPPRFNNAVPRGDNKVALARKAAAQLKKKKNTTKEPVVKEETKKESRQV